jgi:hypothetical protein
VYLLDEGFDQRTLQPPFALDVVRRYMLPS